MVRDRIVVRDHCRLFSHAATSVQGLPIEGTEATRHVARG
jgi:hypothetical protein